jgi:hypothetical protein
MGMDKTTSSKFLPSMEFNQRPILLSSRAQSPSGDGNTLNKNLHLFYSKDDDEFTPEQNILRCMTEKPPHG